MGATKRQGVVETDITRLHGRGRLRIGVKNTLKEVDTVFETDVLTFK
ncbi:MAG: hypothetical protein PHV74_11730 [Dehalococcoidia bacterium]|nr:hypothetical protein [Dehalococcoidia bacterium]